VKTEVAFVVINIPGQIAQPSTPDAGPEKQTDHDNHRSDDD
jgi:hypothetical protein